MMSRRAKTSNPTLARRLSARSTNDSPPSWAPTDPGSQTSSTQCSSSSASARRSRAAAEQREELAEKLEAEKSKLTEADERVAEIKDGMVYQKKDYDTVHK